jgi:hypothetical protein
MSFFEWTPMMGYALPIMAFLFTLFQWLNTRKEKRVEQQKNQRLEAQLSDIIRRGRAPFLRAMFLHIPKADSRPNQILEPGELLDQSTVPDGTVIGLQVANLGEEVRCATDDWPTPYGFLLRNGDLSADDYQATMLRYIYHHAEHGQTRTITLSFETLDGLKLVQTYETKIGFCELKRVDPA